MLIFFFKYRFQIELEKWAKKQKSSPTRLRHIVTLEGREYDIHIESIHSSVTFNLNSVGKDMEKKRPGMDFLN